MGKKKKSDSDIRRLIIEGLKNLKIPVCPRLCSIIVILLLKQS
jgi:hypothetical protein